MNYMKKVMAVLLAVMLMVPSVAANAATSSVKKTALTSSQITVSNVSYTGSFQKAKVTVKYNGKTLVEGKHYSLTNSSHKIVGTHYVTIKGIGIYEGSITKSYKITKNSNVIKTKVAKKTYKVSKVKKKAKTFKIAAKAKGKITYKVTCKKALKKYITVNKNGKVTLKKGAKKGTYKIVVTAKGNSNYKKSTKTIIIKVKK